MKPSSITWPYHFEGITPTIYDFGNGFGALHIEGTVTTVIPEEFAPVDAITETGEPVAVTRSVTVEKNELHPLELPRFHEPSINYRIAPEIAVTAATLPAELERLKRITNGEGPHAEG